MSAQLPTATGGPIKESANQTGSPQRDRHEFAKVYAKRVDRFG